MALRSRKATYHMQAYILTALIGVLFLPGSASGPVQATSTPDDPSPKIAAIAAPGKLATSKEPTTTYTVKLTAYNAVPEQTDSDPSTTASGLASNSEVIAARSHDLAEELPYGTVVAVYGPGKDTPSCNYNKISHLVGYRVIGDSMAARWTKRVDIELDASDTVIVDGTKMNPAEALGVCSGVTIQVVGHLPLSRVPKTQAELARLFAPKTLALNT